MQRALIAATVYFLALFALGFVFGTARVLFVAPRFGELAATLAEVPLMLIAAYLLCSLALRHWQITTKISTRWAMVIWFLSLLITFETLLGALLFSRSLGEQVAMVTTLAGMAGLSAQIIAALLPVFVRTVR